MFLGTLYESLDLVLRDTPSLSPIEAIKDTTDLDKAALLRAVHVFLKLGLVELCSRFGIHQNVLYLQTTPGVTKYPLQSIYGTNYKILNSLSSFAHILDTGEYPGTDQPFHDDVLLLTKAILVDGGNTEVPINVFDDAASLILAQQNIITVPTIYADAGVLLRLEYIASRLPLSYDIEDVIGNVVKLDLWENKQFWLAIPEAYLDVLTYFICWKLLVSISDTTTSIGDEYLARFEETMSLLPTDKFFTTGTYPQDFYRLTSRPYPIERIDTLDIIGYSIKSARYGVVNFDRIAVSTALVAAASLRSLVQTLVVPLNSLTAGTSTVTAGTLTTILIIYSGQAVPDKLLSSTASISTGVLDTILITYTITTDSIDCTTASITGGTLE